MALKSLLKSLQTDKDNQHTIAVSTITINHHLLSHYNPNLGLNHIMMFDKLMTLQIHFGSDKTFGYKQSLFKEELRIGKDKVRSTLNELQKMKLIDIHKNEFVPKKQTYNYSINFEHLIKHPESLWNIPDQSPNDQVAILDLLKEHYKYLEGSYTTKPYKRYTSNKSKSNNTTNHKKRRSIIDSDNKFTF